MKRILYSKLLMLLVVFLVSGCKKDDEDECPACPKIESVIPAEGPYNTEVTIYGRNFKSDYRENIVKFNGKQVLQSDMISGGTTQLKVKVPKGCGTGQISIKVDDDLYSDAGPIFTYEYTVEATTLAGVPGSSGYVNGDALDAEFSFPTDVVIDANGIIFIVDCFNNRIRKLNLNGQVSNYAGTGLAGFNNDFGVSAEFDSPSGICIDNDGNLYVTDADNHCIRKIDPTTYVTTFAGNPGNSGNTDGTGNAARFFNPGGICIDPYDNLFVCDIGNNVIRKITSDGTVSTFAGSGIAGFSDGSLSSAEFYSLHRIAFFKNNLYITDGNRVRRIAGNSVTTIAGGINPGYKNGAALEAEFFGAFGISVRDYYNSVEIFIADGQNHRIRRLVTGQVSNICGSGTMGLMDGSGDIAEFWYPAGGMTWDNNGNLLVAEMSAHRIRKISIE